VACQSYVASYCTKAQYDARPADTIAGLKDVFARNKTLEKPVGSLVLSANRNHLRTVRVSAPVAAYICRGGSILHPSHTQVPLMLNDLLNGVVRAWADDATVMNSLVAADAGAVAAAATKAAAVSARRVRQQHGPQAAGGGHENVNALMVVVPGFLSEYRARPKELEDVCAWNYVLDYVVVTRAQAGRDPERMPLPPSHPQHRTHVCVRRREGKRLVQVFGPRLPALRRVLQVDRTPADDEAAELFCRWLWACKKKIDQSTCWCWKLHAAGGMQS